MNFDDKKSIQSFHRLELNFDHFIDHLEVRHRVERRDNIPALFVCGADLVVRTLGWHGAHVPAVVVARPDDDNASIIEPSPDNDNRLVLRSVKHNLVFFKENVSLLQFLVPREFDSASDEEKLAQMASSSKVVSGERQYLSSSVLELFEQFVKK